MYFLINNYKKLYPLAPEDKGDVKISILKLMQVKEFSENQQLFVNYFDDSACNNFIIVVE